MLEVLGLPLRDILGPGMFLFLIAFIFSGYPVAFSLGATGLLFGVVGLLTGDFNLQYLSLMPQRIFDIMSRQTLLAVPFFIFMGTMLEKSRLAEDLLETIGQLFGPVRGGLAIAVVLVGTLLAATTGVVGATVTAMGLISLPIMLKYGYDKALISGVICASGTLGQIIPPSVVLTVLGDQLGAPVGSLFLGAIIPGLMLSTFFVIYILIFSRLRPELAPALPPEARQFTAGPPFGRNIGQALLWATGAFMVIEVIDLLATGGGIVLKFDRIAWILAVCLALGVAHSFLYQRIGSLWIKAVRAMLPPLLLVLAVLGSIFFGVATATEAGAIGSVLAMVLAALNRRLTIKTMYETSLETAKLTSMVVFILIGSSVFALVFRGLGGDEWVKDIFVSLPGGSLGFMVVSNILIFILGFFIDFFEIVFIVIPLLLPAMAQLPSLLDPTIAGFQQGDMIFFGIILGMNLQTSFLTPPFGFALFYLRGVAPPSIQTGDIYRGVLPFIAIQAVALIITIIFPNISQWLPNLSESLRTGGGS
jgi:TRAP-type mannitol/chloroaromatic compound transport system permease large subunit